MVILNPNQGFTPLEDAIIKRLNEFVSKPETKQLGTTGWTEGIKNTLRTLGKSEDYDYAVCPDPDEGERQWLYDLIWYKNKGENLSELALVAECEWNGAWKQIKYDFEKLLVANGTLRMMICGSLSNGFKDLYDKFDACVQAYMHLRAGERILIAVLDYDSDNEFACGVIIKD